MNDDVADAVKQWLAADALSMSGVEIRYPDNWRNVPDSEMHEMMALAEEFAAILLPRFKLP